LSIPTWLRVTSRFQNRGRRVRGASITDELKKYLERESNSYKPLVNVPSYSHQRYDDLRQRVGDVADLANVERNRFEGAYDSLGELLLIDRDRVVHTIVASDAKGFAHGWWVYR
jgi:hypothetical protein